MDADITLMDAGQSAEGRPIRAASVVPGGLAAPRGWLLLMGAVHGDEHQGTWLLERLLERWRFAFPLRSMGVVICPCVNPDGAERNERCNSRGVDLNRNLPTKDWSPEVSKPGNNPGPSPASELETAAVLGLLERFTPCAIVSVHSMKEYQINSNGPARQWSEALADVCGYPVSEDIGYPCPGSFGTYAGAERMIPTITLEVDRELTQEEVMRVFVPVLECAVTFWDEKSPSSG